MDFIKSHKVLFIILAAILGIFIVMCIIRVARLGYLIAPKDGEVAEVNQEASDDNNVNSLEDDLTSDSTTDATLSSNTETETEEKYNISMGLAGEGNKDGRIEVKKPEPSKKKKKEYQKEPTYPVAVNIFDSTVVPKRNVDGSSCKDFLKSVSLDNFGTNWGSALTEDDFRGHDIILVGVEQDSNDYIRGEDLQSTGWLINNLSKLKDNDAIKFVNLHNIGNLSKAHVALLCSYDWYSVYGLEDTLVVFEDISGTLKVGDFKAGDIFSATVFVHNIKVEKVNGFNILVVQYNTFPSDMKVEKK